MASTKKILIDIRVADKQATISVNKTKKSVDDLATSTRAFTAAQREANKELQKGATSAGLAGAIVTEFGRTVSDLPFGFVAISNNLSQLASLTGLFFANATRSGLTAAQAFKELRTQFLGPVGIITLFQIVLAIFTSEKAKNFISSIFETTKAFGGLREILPDVVKKSRTLVGNFELYTSILRDATETQEQKTIALKKLNKEYPDFNSNILEEADNNREAALAIDEYTDALERRAISQAAEDKFREIRSKIIELSLKKELDVQEQVSKLNKRLATEEFELEQTSQGFAKSRVVSQEEKLSQYQKVTQGIINAADEEIAVERNKLDVLRKLIDLEFKQNDSAIVRDRKQFRKGRLALERIEESFRQKSIDQSLKTEDERIRLAGEFSKKEIDIRVEAFRKSQKVRLDNYVKDIEKSKLSEDRKNELIKAANRDFNQSIIDAEKDASLVKIQIDSATTTELKLLSDERREVVIDNIAAMREAERELAFSKEELALKESFLTSTQRERLEFTREQVDLTVEQTDAEKSRLQSEIDANDRAIQSTKDRLASGELTKEQQDLALVALSDYQLRAVQLDTEYTAASDRNAEARIKIAQAEANAKVQAFQVTADALNAFAKLAGEDTKAGKALAVSGALISTYLSAQKAFESQFKPLATVDSPVRGAIAAAAAVATGLANVKAILSVDPNGESGTKSAPPAPAFNVVGTSVSNQLLDTISGQLGANGVLGGEPIRAYVVGSEVTNQQNLDRQIEQGASLFD
jgi:hypothetical protein